jgi:hypothetical protein
MWLPALGLLALAASAWLSLTRMAMERLPITSAAPGVFRSGAVPAGSFPGAQAIGAPQEAPPIPVAPAARPGTESFQLVGVVTALDADGEPKSLRVVVQAVSRPGGSCGPRPGSGAVLFWGPGTRFDPVHVTEDGTFPANLVGAKISAGGRMQPAEGDGCKLSAGHVRISHHGSRWVQGHGRPPEERGPGACPGADTPSRRGC